MLHSITFDTSTAGTVLTDDITVLFGVAFLARLAVGVTTALEVNR